VRVPDAARFGSLSTDNTGRLTGFREKQPGYGLVNGGVYLFRKSLLERLGCLGPCSMEHDIFPELINNGVNIRVIETEAPFIDIGTPETVMHAETFVRSHLLNS
jgi:D-glycero-alpha-D-manno-heptose 1-phosphate guanylyltransferase